MAELDARHKGFSFNERIAKASMVNLELVDAECVWDNKLCLIGRGGTDLLKVESVEGVQSDKLKLDVFCNEGGPGAIGSSLFEFCLKNDDVLDAVVLWVHSRPLFSLLKRFNMLDEHTL